MNRFTKENILYYLPQRPHFLWHYRRGLFYRYPKCCVIWFCIWQWIPDCMYNPPINFWTRLGMPDDLRQFVTCPYHYKRGLDLHLYTEEQ